GVQDKVRVSQPSPQLDQKPSTWPNLIISLASPSKAGDHAGHRCKPLKSNTSEQVPASQPRRRRPERRLKCIRAFDLQFALVDAVATGGEEGVKVFAAEAKIGDLAVGRRDDAIHAARLVADLDADAAGDIKPAF